MPLSHFYPTTPYSTQNNNNNRDTRQTKQAQKRKTNKLKHFNCNIIYIVVYKDPVKSPGKKNMIIVHKSTTHMMP